MKPATIMLALASTALATGATQFALQPALAAAQQPGATLEAKAEIGDYGFDTTGMDPSVTPGEDFFRYANGTWLKDTPIPDDRSNFGMFSVLDDLSKNRTKTILEAAKADPASKIGNAYASYLDEATVEARGLAPIQPWLAQIKGVTTRAAYIDLLAAATRNGVAMPLRLGVGQDDKDPENYALFLMQGGLGMPDRDYYLLDTPQMIETRNAYLTHLETMFTLAGEPDGAARAAAILAFETEIAKVHWTRVDSRDADKTYNKMSVADLMKASAGFDFVTLFAKSGTPVETIIVSQPSAVTGEAAIIAKTPLAVLKDHLIVRSLNGFADVLPDAIADENFAFYGKTLSGTPEREPRWKRAVNFTTGALGEDVGKDYVARYFPPEAKAAADAMVQNILAAMGRRIDMLSWMSDEAKAGAHQKLAAFTPKIGYPEKWRDYGALTIKRDDLFGNALRANRYEHDYDSARLGKPVDRAEWFMTPMEINAYANFGMVEIVFPAAILQPPFFDPHADAAVNYGGIGAVIGHEISHHFDDQGAKYDNHGRLSPWWTEDDVKNFEALTAQLVKQYDTYEPLPGEHVNGKLTLGENIADLAGLTVAYDAYKASLGGKDAPIIDGTTGDQRFYLGWAQVWRRNYREANLRQRLLTDPHSPSEQRVTIVRNLDPWYGAFAIPADAPLALDSANRVRIW